MRNPLARRLSRVAALTTAAALALAITACSPPEDDKSSDTDTAKAAEATSAKDFGSLEDLVAAAKKEGELNVIALPPDWANYGNIIKAFEEKYDLKVNSAQPDASSADEITAAKSLKGQDRAPDVFDLGPAVATANTDLFAPYQVQTFADIPAELKDPKGLWVNDYGGYMSIGYDSSKVPAPTSVADLLKPEYKGKVALNGDPTQAGAAFSGVVMASLGNGGSADDIAPGVEFFKKLKAAGNFLPVDPTPATIESGQTPVVIDWDYLNVGQGEKLKGKVDWKTVVPANAVVGSYYVQAINKDAPHPAAARLWQEFLYSDEGQNLWLAGGARPVRADAMEKAGTIDKDAFAKLPAVSGTPVFQTEAQTTKAKEYLAANWAKAVA
ncbi:ABC transporter substrate-binding protein [Cryptosporangium aurantiacum]|uniref:Putative spermidine/putrescine transport system substrate-binding protein n=1 Tax=Cryptosporangium aurantiacum TaxID=134849 RepID=A0A1M7MXA1_9ACTN|nr:extracellular solute-binding protein [Cryptosporangium aurantiacum]SHM95238.1 putative spermidine/putrescine transport system substrate-binding protein [Cryptosporangium aurantiacum]